MIQVRSFDCPRLVKHPWQIWVNRLHDSTENVFIIATTNQTHTVVFMYSGICAIIVCICFRVWRRMRSVGKAFVICVLYSLITITYSLWISQVGTRSRPLSLTHWLLLRNRFDVIVTLFLRHVSAGKQFHLYLMEKGVRLSYQVQTMAGDGISINAQLTFQMITLLQVYLYRQSQYSKTWDSKCLALIAQIVRAFGMNPKVAVLVTLRSRRFCLNTRSKSRSNHNITITQFIFKLDINILIHCTLFVVGVKVNGVADLSGCI